MDIALNCGERRETVTHRMDKIAKKLQEGDYAKVLQKVRQVVKKHKGTRAVLVKRVNADVGWWRCAATQMEVLQRSFHTVPRQVWLRAAHAILDRDTVHLDVDTLAELERACDAEAQEAARQVLVDLGDRIALSSDSQNIARGSWKL